MGAVYLYTVKLQQQQYTAIAIYLGISDDRICMYTMINAWRCCCMYSHNIEVKVNNQTTSYPVHEQHRDSDTIVNGDRGAEESSFILYMRENIYFSCQYKSSSHRQVAIYGVVDYSYIHRAIYFMLHVGYMHVYACIHRKYGTGCVTLYGYSYT